MLKLDQTFQELLQLSLFNDWKVSCSAYGVNVWGCPMSSINATLEYFVFGALVTSEWVTLRTQWAGPQKYWLLSDTTAAIKAQKGF